MKLVSDTSAPPQNAVAALVLGNSSLMTMVPRSSTSTTYAIDADAQKVFGWTVGENGELTPVGAFDGMPATVAGLAAS